MRWWGLALQRKIGSGIKFDEIETDIGTCLPIHGVVSVCLYESCLTQMDSKSNTAKFLKSFCSFLNGIMNASNFSEKELYDCIREESKADWGLLRLEDCKDDFTANATTNFFPKTCCTKHMKHDKREPGLVKEEFRFTEMLCLSSKTYCWINPDSNSKKYNFSSKGLRKRTLEDCGDCPIAKYRKVLDQFINVTSTDRGFRTVHHSVATYGPTKKGLSYFYPQRIVDVDGIHTVL